jgi:hypothetical protein
MKTLLEELKIQPIKFIQNYQTYWKQQNVKEWKTTENHYRFSIQAQREEKVRKVTEEMALKP